jgi:hypothetical protein
MKELHLRGKGVHDETPVQICDAMAMLFAMPHVD